MASKAREPHLAISGALLLSPEQDLSRKEGVPCPVKRHKSSGNIELGHGHVRLMRPITMPAYAPNLSFKNARNHRQQKAGVVRHLKDVGTGSQFRTWLRHGPLGRCCLRLSLGVGTVTAWTARAFSECGLNDEGIKKNNNTLYPALSRHPQV